KIEILNDEDIAAMVTDKLVAAQRARALTPDKPVLRGTAQNPDVFFQAREACNLFYDACPKLVQESMDEFAKVAGRSYKLFDYVGHPQAERVIIIMGSGAETADETVEHLVNQGEKVGIIKVRLFRPFCIDSFINALPKTVKKIAVLDRTKEPGAIADPLYQDIVSAFQRARLLGKDPFATDPMIVGGRYGLSSKEFTPAMIKGVYDELSKPSPKAIFTVGIVDDVTQLSLKWDDDWMIEPNDVHRAVFFGLGADGTVGANKNSIKIIAEDTGDCGQGYFVYDSKKSGAITISHLRFGHRPIKSAYLIKQAQFVACHQWQFVDKYDMLQYAAKGATLLLNSPYTQYEVWDHLPLEVQEGILEKRLKVYTIDAYKVAKEQGMGVRINTIMQTCFFAISGVLEQAEAIKAIKKAIEKTYGKKGPELVKRNFAAVDASIANLHEVKLGTRANSTYKTPPMVSDKAPDFVKRVSAVMMANKGDLLPVSAFPIDGTWPLSTTQWEKRSIARDIPVWDSTICIQCNKCAMACPHAAIRAKVYEPGQLTNAPATYKSTDYKGAEFKGQKFTIQVAPEDCTGCSLCVMVCPAKDKTKPKHKAIDMTPMAPLRDAERTNYEFFLNLPEVDRTKVKLDVKGAQLLQPLFEYSGACSGCGETPYVKLLTQLFGDRAIIGNATGCSSIYGGNLPTTPYRTDKNGRGPAWSNSLFEDNAEFGMGMRLAIDKHKEQAQEMLKAMSVEIGEQLVGELLSADQAGEAGIAAQRLRVVALKQKLASISTPMSARLMLLADYLVKKSVWILGGDGWAYDIGYGGLDHVLACGYDVNILVLDTEVYSNTGGQASKSTPTGAAAKFASAGKSGMKKDLGLMAMAYGNVYVGKVAFGAKDVQTVKTFVEAESYHGPSIIIAFSHCIAHGYDLAYGCEQQKLAVDTGYWPLFRYDPRRAAVGEIPLQLDSGAPKAPLSSYTVNETRFRMVEQMYPERFKMLMGQAQTDINNRFSLYEQMAKIAVGGTRKEEQSAAPAAEPKP
ncbi:MAG: pyruvate:ferredoxin (flavodoxin) oxidoreductase, partial [Tepidisphaeraceae bacterium]